MPGSLHILVTSFFRHFGCVIFFMLNFHFARLAYFKQTEDDQSTKKDRKNEVTKIKRNRHNYHDLPGFG